MLAGITGSILLKKGTNDIDVRTYFRAEVFGQLTWLADPRTAGKELAEANFQIVISSVDYGMHRLTVTHDTRTNTRSYDRHQPMSGLRWGTARPLIAKEDLLDRMMQSGQPYSAAVRSILSAEDTTERAWLEELLA